MAPTIAVRNEQRRIEAAWLNNVGVAFVAIGCVTPGVAIVYHLTTAPEPARWTTYTLPFVSLVAGLGFNRLACWVLRTVV